MVELSINMSSSLSLESVCSARCFSPSSSAIGAVPGVRRKLCVSVREKPEQPVGAVFVGCSTKHRKSRNHEMWSSSRDCITSAHSAGLDFASSKEGNACATTSSKSGARFLHDEGMGTIDRAEAVRAQLFPRLNKLSPVKSLRRRCVSPSTRVVTSVLVPPREQYADETDYMKAGGEFIDLVQLQARKPLQQTKIGEKLEPLSDKLLDLVVIGCGPAGLSLAAEAAKQGLEVGLIGPDLPFTNNYGVWEDEFAALGLENCIEQIWRDSAMYFESDTPLLIGRAYGRVDRHLLHEELLKRCADGGVQYLDTEVERISDADDTGSTVMCANGAVIRCRLVTVASGAAAGRFLEYEPGGPGTTVQTAYGMEVECENFNYDPEIMLFMDYRDYQAWGTEPCPDADEFKQVPSFLYAMPVSKTRVFFEETCLAARPTMSFNLLKERLLMRLNSMGIKVVHMYEEEWSYIPVGATLPDTTQQHLGFGAAASMVHPATGYSVVRSLSEAPHYAAAIASSLRSGGKSVDVNSMVIQSWKHPRAAALEAWNALWPSERKRQRAFFLFGLELILQLDLVGIREFFATFFELPEWLWKGFLAAKLSSLDLIMFALITFVVAPNSLRYRLVRHLMTDPSGSYLIRTYLGLKGTAELPAAKEMR
ncbi:lycopene beta-cyclase [Marchantia polymorpha subsp. ruderalis]|uniref:Lycopene epsilon-cyclase n=3 Tax=Marchantia polymorpha TaxID=3197 RepID=A0AAF6BWK1_MARPO|nr:hypothetical protein MARPO_0057s0089 [Marchantia polymorpha]PTQ37472.1 hypothetical protein MARPO_0057s0089 [Marchantia polymorpha]BAO27800.1 lycopene epsilon-cyclase [Marchantia polymorpha]BBN16385.1 hypothetical protein Mp_7g05820 [Marchantia polymorpha subsp. ruderalis]BBN16386.1 hypothetical protein Mp_7g05820 [Marchantia polymorpha subsp. ruderalis]|eukprot:PTQ37471.1 hypothetical protein MARPO_0057s0089 [Marchantia polymorpha]